VKKGTLLPPADLGLQAAVELVVLIAWVGIHPLRSPDPLRMVRSIELPHVEGRIDHLALDSAGQRLFVAALGNNSVEVVDVRNGTHLKSLPGFREPQGIAVASDANRIAIANGQGDGVQLIDATDYRVTTAVSLGEDSDNVRYDAATRRLYVGYGEGGLAAIDPTDGRVVGRVKLAGHPESFQLERAASRIFVNVPTAGHIAVVDRNAMRVVATWPVTGARANFPMALDEANHVLFIGCRTPATVLAFDTASGKEIGRAETVGDTDDLFVDLPRKRLYIAGGEGAIDVLDARVATAMTRVARVNTAPGARTALFAPNQSRVYLAVPHRGAQRSEIRMFDAQD
jgi:DNA-binding beta-propeller fold protein YncE